MNVTVNVSKSIEMALKHVCLQSQLLKDDKTGTTFETQAGRV